MEDVLLRRDDSSYIDRSISKFIYVKIKYKLLNKIIDWNIFKCGCTCFKWSSLTTKLLYIKDEIMGKRRSEINGPKEPSTGPSLDFESSEEAMGINSKERDFLAFLA